MHDLFDTNVQDFLGAIYNLKTNMLESLFTQQIIPNCEPQKNVFCASKYVGLPYLVECANFVFFCWSINAKNCWGFVFRIVLQFDTFKFGALQFDAFWGIGHSAKCHLADPMKLCHVYWNTSILSCTALIFISITTSFIIVIKNNLSYDWTIFWRTKPFFIRQHNFHFSNNLNHFLMHKTLFWSRRIREFFILYWMHD